MHLISTHTNHMLGHKWHPCTSDISKYSAEFLRTSALFTAAIQSKVGLYTPVLPWQWRSTLLRNVGRRAETRFRLSAKRKSPFKSVGASVQSTTGSRDVCISGSKAGCIMFRGSVKSTGYPLHSPVSASLPLPCVTVCHHISTGIYVFTRIKLHCVSYHKVGACKVRWFKIS